jgi:2-keto-3-deoxy-6-phosphogluconate aldolase
MASRTYEIIFRGEAVPAIVDAFEDFDVTVGAGRTTLRGEQLDQAALHGAIDRLQNLGLELLEVRAI